MLNPSITHHTADGAAGGRAIFTDDVSLRVFMKHPQIEAPREVYSYNSLHSSSNGRIELAKT